MVDIPDPNLTNILLVLQVSSFKHRFLQRWNEFFFLYGPIEHYVDLFRALFTLYILSPFLDCEILEGKVCFPISGNNAYPSALHKAVLNKLLNLLNPLPL